MNVLSKIALGAMALPAMHSMAQTGKPNIILIMTDQQSYNAISAYADITDGSYFSTPNIDRLAKNGISFTRTYCTNPVSVPSRFALFTGMYGGQYGVRENQSADADETEVRSMLATNGMGTVFENGGYDTYYGGKVHLPFSATEGRSKFARPVGYGFKNCFTEDEREGLGNESADIIDAKGREKSAKPFLLVASFLNPHDICLESSTNLSTEVKGKNKGKKGLIADCVRSMRAKAAAIDSVEFYKNHAPQLPYNFNPTALYPTMKKSPNKDFPNWYWRKYRWTYGQLVSLVDSHIGSILDALDRNPELKKNTIVVFTSDHGEMQGAHQTVTKNLPYEECQRVPFIFCGRGIKGEQRDNSLVCNGIDLLPTLCELAGINIPQKHDGESLAKRVLGKGKAVDRKTLYVEGDGFLNIISDDNKYTLFDGKNSGEMLIDMHSDKGELKNVIAGNEPKAAEMRNLLPLSNLKGALNTGKNKKSKKNKEETVEDNDGVLDAKAAKRAAKKAAKKSQKNK